MPQAFNEEAPLALNTYLLRGERVKIKVRVESVLNRNDIMFFKSG